MALITIVAHARPAIIVGFLLLPFALRGVPLFNVRLVLP